MLKLNIPRLHLILRHQFPAPVWRVIPSATHLTTWAIECRHSTGKQVSYSFINKDFELGKVNYEADWWTGIEAVSGNYIIFHQYQQQDLPLHKGISVYDTQAGKIIWENEYITFVSLFGNQLKALSTLGQGKTFILSIESGEEITEETKVPETFPSPTLIHERDLYFRELERFIAEYTHWKPVILTEYLETQEHIILSYYIYNESKLENYLLVTDLEGSELLHISLASDIKGPSPGTFAVTNGFLSFVKDRSELFITDLS